MKRRNEIVKKGKKILELFDQDKRFVPYIIADTDICDDITTKIKIGSGSQGKVYKIKFRNDRKTYIMKKSYLNPFHIYELETEKIIKYISKKVSDVSELSIKEFILLIMDYYDLHNRVSWKKLLRYNHLKRNEIPDYDILNEFFLPAEDIDCRVSESRTYDYNLDFEGTIQVEPGDYVCFSSIFVETIISLLLSRLVREDICYHYTVFFSSIVCNESFEFYIEKMDSSLIDLIYDKDVDVNDVFDVSNLFSIVVSIMIMSEKYNICHNDLAFRNILVKQSSKLERFSKARYIRYIINDITFEFPFPKYLYKISDFGYAQKFSHPMVLDYENLVLNNSHVPNFDTYGLFDLYKFFNDIVMYIYSGIEINKYIDQFLIDMFGSKNIALDFLSDSREEVLLESVRDVIADSKFELNTKYLKKVFKEFIVKKNTVNTNAFVAVNYKSD